MKRQLLPFLVTLGGIAAVFILVLLLAFDPAAARPAEFVMEQAPAVDIASAMPPSSIAPLSDRRVHPPQIRQRPEFFHSGAADPYPVSSLEILVNYAREWVAGSTDPGATLAVTVTDNVGTLKDNAVVAADGFGDFFVGCSDWFSGQCPDIQPNDRVMVGAEGILNEVSPVGSISGKLDAVENTVSGELNADWFNGPLEVRCEIWEDPEPPPIVKSANTGGGAFTCDFDDVGWDLEYGQTVALWYIEPDGDGVINLPPWARGRVNYARDDVGVNYEIGHTFWLTVTDSVGSVKGTATAETTSTGGWGAPGFDTRPEQWSPEQPDLMPGDWVYFAADDGYTNTIQVGAISGNVSVEADLVTGTVAAPGFGVSLTIECHPWGAWDAGIDAPVKESFAEPDGSVPYSCAWDPATEWDMQPGQDIAVLYVEPDWDQIVNVVREPAAHLNIAKVYESSRLPKATVTYTLNFSNVGAAPASGLVISDHAPSNVTWKNGGNYDASSQIITWTWPSLAVDTSGSVQFTGQLACDGQAVNDRYRVAARDQGVTSSWGDPLSFTILEPTVQADFSRSATQVRPGETVVFTDTTTSNGPPLATFGWDFGDGEFGSGASVSHSFASTGTYDVELTVADECGYSDTVSRSIAVDYVTYIPFVIND